MRINNNIMAFNAQRNLGASAMSMGKSIEKLSSGLRINRAADDASGLVISQKLRAQTSGLRQATRNAQDGISVVQTAEGGLNEVHSMLNRMRDLAVQAANTGANDATARSAAQQELSQLRTEIDRIGNTTSFGDVKLLNGSFGVSAASATGYDADNSVVVAGTEVLATQRQRLRRSTSATSRPAPTPALRSPPSSRTRSRLPSVATPVQPPLPTPTT